MRQHPRAGSALGVKHTEEFKRQVSKARKGKKRPEWLNQYFSEMWKGRVFSDDWKKKISDSMKERVRQGKGRPWLGRKHSPETIEKMRNAALGKKHTPETIAKIKESHRLRLSRVEQSHGE